MKLFILLTFIFTNVIGELTLLNQNNFKNGTYRIIKSGIYKLTSNIIFNPNPINDLSNVNNYEYAWLPSNNSNNYPNGEDGAFSVGFFAVITIETDNVTIDCSNYEIKMHDYFHFQQRFFSIIDANVPFELNTGPANFGSVIPTLGITIQNCKIGKSSHHGIHMNSVTNITIINTKIYNFEVAGIHLNHYLNARIENVEIGPSLQIVYPNVYYSNARFLLPKLRKIVARNSSLSIKFGDRSYSMNVSAILNSLIKSMNLYFKYIFVDGRPNINKITRASQSVTDIKNAYNLFHNNNIKPDSASIYGIILNSFSAAVFGFGDSSNISSNVILNNISIHDISINVREIIGYYPSTTNNRLPVRGVFSDVLSMGLICLNDTTTNILSTCSYKGNVLSDAQNAIGIHGISSLDETGLTYSPTIYQNWIQNISNKLTSGNFRCGNDIMTHTIKGLMGIRIDNSINATLNNIKIYNLINESPLGSYICGEYQSENDVGGGFGTFDGYMGAHIRGIVITNSDNIKLSNILINNLNSYNGNVYGISLIDDSNIIIESNLNKISFLKAGSLISISSINYIMNNHTYPNQLPNVCSIDYDDTSSVQYLSSNDFINISNLNGYDYSCSDFIASWN